MEHSSQHTTKNASSATKAGKAKVHTKQNKPKKQRLDDVLVSRGFFNTTQAALRGVLAHEVKVDDVYATSAASLISPSADIQVKGAKQFVSRGGHKLQGALNAFGQSVCSLKCIDIGASTGGFTDCLLQAGAAHVTCVDVNYGQLAWSIRQSSRTTIYERTNIRLANPQQLGAPFDVLVADLSFIGLARLAPTFAALCHAKSVFIGLVKPQFESKFGETEHGIVQSECVRQRTVAEVSEALQHAGFKVTGTIESPIQGRAGNVEYLVRAVFES